MFPERQNRVELGGGESEPRPGIRVQRTRDLELLLPWLIIKSPQGRKTTEESRQVGDSFGE